MSKVKVVETEREFQNKVIELAHLNHWLVAHFRPARVLRHGKEIYETAVGADGKGFPYLVLVRGGEIIFAELKSENGKLSPEQETWRFALDSVSLCVVWRPSDWDAIVELLG